MGQYWVGRDALAQGNTSKKINGAFGQYQDSVTGSLGSGLPAKLVRKSDNRVVATGMTDQDGFYALPCRHTGARALFTVVLGSGTSAVSRVVELKANGWAEVSYDAGTNTWVVDVSGR